MNNIIAITDTHALIWYLMADKHLSSIAQQTFNDAVNQSRYIGVPIICIIEIIYLVEKGKIPLLALTKLLKELQEPDSVLTIISLDLEIAVNIRNIDRSQIPDMPDRIIAASALHFNVPLITRDHLIKSTSLTTIW